MFLINIESSAAGDLDRVYKLKERWSWEPITFQDDLASPTERETAPGGFTLVDVHIDK